MLIKRIIEKSGLPFDTAEVRDNIEISNFAGLSPEKPGQAFDKLMELEVDAVVCEGATRFLPLWRGGPPVRHLVYVGGGTVSLFPNLSLRFPGSASPALPAVEDLRGALASRKVGRSSVPFYLVEEERREVAAQGTVRELVDSLPKDVPLD